MKTDTLGAAWRFAIVAIVCLLAAFGMIAVFGQLRFDRETIYRAEFTNVSGLKVGNFVRVAGVEIGKVRNIAIRDSKIAVVEFGVSKDVALTLGTKAVVRYQNLTGERYLALQEGAGGLAALPRGGTIPIDRTAPALDLDALIGGLKPLFRALNPDQVNTLTQQLIAALQGEGPTVGSFLRQTAVFTSTLADRDALIGDVITNLNTVLGSVSDQSRQLDTAVSTLSDLVGALAARKTDVRDSLAALNTSSATLADLFTQIRPPLTKSVTQADRAAAIVVADHDFFQDFLSRLLPTYKLLSRQGLYGDFFNAYMCELVLKVNGKGGQPTYVRVASQTTGRCAPK
ncbi:mammalian cell entry protein [Mycobacterium sp. 852002-51971_SCH5477799-a]|uniref:MCE family protein n=1 Tax=Mycobacterium sp. 852002-51971_SCH5477799-a TaxID=1834106 RepID=UPI0007FF54E8|nr:MCE family protein [Mycobacterium sp. 852002-51971_SCH5477799-a]OBF69108.1 mammalian cell entry protein [Mycobacterium sp. 852002-51971_SCH5477799-a]